MAGLSQLDPGSLPLKAEAERALNRLESSRAWLGAVVLSFGLTGCQQSGSPKGPGSPATDLRIVSLTPSLTELLFALEAGPQVVGVTGNDHFPPEVDALPEVGDLQVNYEALLALTPDLVVLDPEMNQQHVRRLRALGIPLEAVETQSLEDLQRAIDRLGHRLGRAQQARALQQHLRNVLDRAEERRSQLAYRPTCWVEIWHDPWIGAGQLSYVGEVVETAGFRVVHQGDRGYPRVSLEELHRLDPDAILLTHPVAQELAKNPAWSRLRAVQRGKVLHIQEDWLVRPGPRVTEAVVNLQAWLEAQDW